MSCKFNIGDKVKVLQSFTDLGYSVGKTLTITDVLPIWSDYRGEIWYNISANGRCFLPEHLELVAEREGILTADDREVLDTAVRVLERSGGRGVQMLKKQHPESYKREEILQELHALSSVKDLIKDRLK